MRGIEKHNQLKTISYEEGAKKAADLHKLEMSCQSFPEGQVSLNAQSSEEGIYPKICIYSIPNFVRT